MTHGRSQVPSPINEPVCDHAPGSPQRASLKRHLDALAEDKVEVPLIIGGEEVTTGRTAPMVMPHAHGHELGVFHKAGAEEVQRAIAAAEEARPAWAALPWEERAAVFLRAADLLAGPWRDRINAATMLGQSKTAHQAEIDAACELIDFWRFNVHFAERIFADQPESSPGCWNRVEYRPLDGFVFAVTPFNFTSIAGNLPTAPALMGNTALWKPASTSVFSNYFLMKLLEEAGLPPGVVNFVPGSGAEVGDPVVADPHLGGVHFTGSTEVFQGIWNSVGKNIQSYGQYPRLVGETGGKDFLFAHPSSDVESLATALVRGAFEYQGQKCSAASRAYLPKSLWPAVREQMGDVLAEIRMGDVRDFRNFVGAVIDRASFDKLSGVQERARADATAEIVLGGESDGSSGWFVQPTVVEVSDPKHDFLRTEFFGPIPDRLRLRRRALRGDPRTLRRHLHLRSDRGHLCPGSRGGAPGDRSPAPCGRQLLRQRQADRCRRRSAALRWFARLGHQRQGRLCHESLALDQRTYDQGKPSCRRPTIAIPSCRRNSPGR